VQTAPEMVLTTVAKTALEIVQTTLVKTVPETSPVYNRDTKTTPEITQKVIETTPTIVLETTQMVIETTPTIVLETTQMVIETTLEDTIEALATKLITLDGTDLEETTLNRAKSLYSIG
jgi:hypothetical protein